MTSPNFMVIGLQIRKLHRGAESAPPPAVLDSKKPGLFRVNDYCAKIGGFSIDIAFLLLVSYSYLIFEVTSEGKRNYPKAKFPPNLTKGRADRILTFLSLFYFQNFILNIFLANTSTKYTQNILPLP